MATLPESTHTTAAQIVKWYESKPQDHRPHMGASLIGHQCARHIFRDFNSIFRFITHDDHSISFMPQHCMSGYLRRLSVCLHNSWMT